MEDVIVYKVAVPIAIEEIRRNGIEQYIAELKKTDTTRVFVALEVVGQDVEKRNKDLADLAEATKALKAAGYEVGMWVWTFLRETPNNFTKRHIFNGRIAGGETCRLDPVVELKEKFGSAEFINCTGELKGDKVYLSDLTPYTFSAIILKK